jgi:hypothetical protein
MRLAQDKEQTVEKLQQALLDWLAEAGNARSTLAGAVVVLDKIRLKAPIKRSDIFTTGGQLIGGRGVALRDTLSHYGEERNLLADGVTTRSTLKFERLAEAMGWGKELADWTEDEREIAVQRLTQPIRKKIDDYFLRQQIHLEIDRSESPSIWIEQLFREAKERSQGRVEQHLVGAKLERRMPQQDVAAHAAFAADVQTQRAGDFVVGDIVFHVTAVPALPVIEKCHDNLRKNLHPVLVIPRDKIERAKGIASASATPDLERRISFVAIEDFIATNIIELAGAEGASFVDVLQSILTLYNERILQSETDKSLRIDLG